MEPGVKIQQGDLTIAVQVRADGLVRVQNGRHWVTLSQYGHRTNAPWDCVTDVLSSGGRWAMITSAGLTVTVIGLLVWMAVAAGYDQEPVLSGVAIGAILWSLCNQLREAWLLRPGRAKA